MTLPLSLFPIFLALLQPARATATYDLTRSYSGSTFFDRWTYYGYYDNTTDGDVTFANQSIATSTSTPLTYLNDAGNAIIKVDNKSTVAYNYKRNSVKITSKDTYDVGSVWVLDAVHVPYGCSVWPAFWSKGANWPTGGEIDTFEGVNLQVSNQMTLHTESGCTLTQSTTAYTGTTNSTDCYEGDNDNAGCGISGTAASYGAAFAKAGGGVWVTELADAGVSIWFFTRSEIPTAVSTATASIDTSLLGTPTAFWSSDSCEIEEFFAAQSLIFDITLCGSWAGEAATLADTCPTLVGTQTCYTTYVLDAANYDNAYFEIKSLKVYSNATSTSSTSGAGRRWAGMGVGAVAVLVVVGGLVW